jgi:uncharacterized membrane protein
MARKTSGFRDWVGVRWRGLKDRWQRPGGGTGSAQPKDERGRDVPGRPLAERLEARFEDMMREVDQLSTRRYTVEEHAEYGWIVLIRLLLPLVFFLGFGYEDGLFMTGFRYLSLEPFILLMYVIGYGLEGLRVAMVYSMNFSQSEGRTSAFRRQFTIWLIMSIGCGVAQLASALVIQALGGDRALTGNNALSQGAKAIMASIPWLIYLAIGIRVGLCAIADWACSGYLHRKKETVEQKVAQITTRANNLVTVVQSQINAESMIDNAKQFQEMVKGQRQELQQLRDQQRSVFELVFQAGMRQVHRVTEEPHVPQQLSQGEDDA